MSIVQESESAIPRLHAPKSKSSNYAHGRCFLQNQCELTDEVKAKLDQSRREIAAGNYTTRQPK